MRTWGFSKELVKQIAGNSYLQYFIGFLDYQKELPFDSDTMVLFHKRINAQMITEANEYMLSNLNKKCGEYDSSKSLAGGGPSKNDLTSERLENNGTLILDATCTPVVKPKLDLISRRYLY